MQLVKKKTKLMHFLKSKSTEKIQKYIFPGKILNLKLFQISKVIKNSKSLKRFPMEIMKLYILQIYKIPKKLPIFWKLTLPGSFNLLTFYFVNNANFQIYHHGCTLIVHVQNTDPNPEILWLLTQINYRWTIRCLTLTQCLTLPQFTLLLTLPEKCTYSKFFWSKFSRIRTKYLIVDTQ